jgi:hypothetical protein
MIWLALILSLIPQDEVPDHRVVGWVIPMPVQQDELMTGPITAAITKRLDELKAAWDAREGLIEKSLREFEERAEQRQRERFEFIREWIEGIRPGPVDIGPVREFFGEWKAERETARLERAEAAAERQAWREDRERWKRDSESASKERKTLLERIAESREAMIEARTAAYEARAQAEAAALQARSALQSTGPIREGLRLLINLVWAIFALVSLLVVVALIVGGYRAFRTVTDEVGL